MAKHEHTGYGFFPGGDPRRFHPDDSATPEEIATHKAVCGAWDKGTVEMAPQDPDCLHLDGGSAKAIMTRCQFGLGVYTYDCEDLSCPEGQRDEAPPDVFDAYGALERWWDSDGGFSETDLEASKKDLMRDAFAAGFKAHEDLVEGERDGI